MRAVFLVGALAACASRRAPETVGNRAAPPPKPVCTEELQHRFAKDLQARWNTTEVSIVRCTPGLFPIAGFFLETNDRVGVIATDGSVIVPFEPRGPLPIATSIVECAAVDLDGDGVDEIVETWVRNAGGRLDTNNWLEVRRIEDERLATIRGPHTTVFHPDLGACIAEVRLAGRTIVIEVDSPRGIPPSDCLTAGTHTFALEHDALVEINPRVSTR